MVSYGDRQATAAFGAAHPSKTNYVVDAAEDCPQGGGMVEYSRNLDRGLKARLGARLVFVRDIAGGLGCADARGPCRHRERRAIVALAEARPDSIIVVPNAENPLLHCARVSKVVHGVEFCVLSELFAADQW